MYCRQPPCLWLYVFKYLMSQFTWTFPSIAHINNGRNRFKPEPSINTISRLKTLFIEIIFSKYQYWVYRYILINFTFDWLTLKNFDGLHWGLHWRRARNLLTLMKSSTACLQRISSLISSQNISSPSMTVAARVTLRGQSGWPTCSPVGLDLSLVLMKEKRVESSHWELTDFSRSGMMAVFGMGTRYSTGISWGYQYNDLFSIQLLSQPTCSKGFWSFLIMILALTSPRNLMRSSTWHSLVCLSGLFLALTLSPI